MQKIACLPKSLNLILIVFQKRFFLLILNSTTILYASSILSNPKTLNLGPEQRHKPHNNRLRPCGRSSPTGPEGRKFLDWSVEFVDVTYNFNYNCGGNTPLLPGGTGGLLGSHLQGTSQLANHFQLGNRPQGGGIFGLFPLLFGGGGSASQTSSQSSSQSSSQGVSGGVQVPQDPVLPNRTPPMYRPGTYVKISNPIFGSYTQDLSNINPNRILRQFDRELNKLARPLYHLLRK